MFVNVCYIINHAYLVLLRFGHTGYTGIINHYILFFHVLILKHKRITFNRTHDSYSFNFLKLNMKICKRYLKFYLILVYIIKKINYK